MRIGELTKVQSDWREGLRDLAQSRISNFNEVWQHRDVGVPRNKPQHLPISHHLTTVTIISPDVAAYTWCAECKPLRSSTCPKTRRVDRAYVGWSPWRGAGRPDSVSDSESECCDLEGLEPSPVLQHSMTSQSTGCFPSLCPVQHRTLGICSQLFGSRISKITPLMSGPSKPWELDPLARRRRVRALLIQAALWASTMNEKDAALTDAACCPAFKGSASSSGEIATNATVQQHRDVGVPRNNQQQLPVSHHLTTVIISPDFSMRPTLHNLYVFAVRVPQTRACLPPLCLMSSWSHRCTSEYTPPAGQRLGSALKYQRRMTASGSGPARSIVAVKTVLKESWRKQAPSAPIQRHRKLTAAAKRSKNQVDLSLLNQAMQQQKQSQHQAPPCREAQ